MGLLLLARGNLKIRGRDERKEDKERGNKREKMNYVEQKREN